MTEKQSDNKNPKLRKEFEETLKELIIMSQTNEKVRHFLDDLKEVLERNAETSTEKFSEALERLREKHMPDGVKPWEQ